jgi:hypothetical protein
MKTAATPAFFGIISLYALVAGILVLPILRFVENHSLAANYSPAVIASPDMQKSRTTSDTTLAKDNFITKVFSANENSARCRRVKVIIADYSFLDVQTKRCMGRFYQFVATRKGEKVLIEFNALTDKFVKVAKFRPSTANGASEEP